VFVESVPVTGDGCGGGCVEQAHVMVSIVWRVVAQVGGHAKGQRVLDWVS